MQNLFSFRPKVTSTAPKERIYAIGDIHGCYDLLRCLISVIVAHWEASEKKPRRVRLLFLGDVIDRGPDSADCLRLIANLGKLPGVTCLKGNHEDLLLRSIAGDAEAQQIWLRNGGLATLASFEIDPPSSTEDSFDFGERIKAAIPAEHLEFLQAAPAWLRSGDYFFAHAGVRPGVPLKRQDNFDLFFIRDEFTQSKEWHGALIVHGHSIVEHIEIRENRIAIDTGAYKSGRLSCICLEGANRQVLAVGPEDRCC